MQGNDLFTMLVNKYKKTINGWVVYKFQ